MLDVTHNLSWEGQWDLWEQVYFEQISILQTMGLSTPKPEYTFFSWFSIIIKLV